MSSDALRRHDVLARPRSLSHRLDREWDQMCQHPEVLTRVRSWRLTNVPFRSLDEFLTLTGHHAVPTPKADELLSRLVAVAANEPIACRIVLQRILPGLLAIVATEQRRDPRVDAFDLIVGEAWISIATYRIATRPTDVAARLLNDARHRAFTGGRRRRVVEEIATDAAELTEVAHDAASAPFDELVAVVTEARRRGLDDGSVATIREFLNRGSSADVATACAVSERAVRYRNRRAIRQIRRLVAA